MKISSTQHYSRDLQRYYRLPATQVSLTIVLSLFIVAVFVIFALGPTILAIIALQKNITDSQETLTKLDAKIVTLERVTTQLEALKPQLPTLNLSVPNTGAMYSPLTATIEALAAQTGVVIQSEAIGPTLLYSRILSPFAPSRAQSVIALPLSIRVTGGYPAISLFLSQLLSTQRIVTIDSITITKETSSATSETVVSLTISGSAYYLADEAQLKKALPEKGKK